MKLKFRDESKAKELIATIKKLTPPEPVKIVHVCGTHEITISEHGLRSLLPPEIEILEGPGCPVCVTPASDLDAVISLAEEGAIVVTFGDMMRVPGTRKTLEEVRSEGGDVRIVYSPYDGLKIARGTDKEVVFFGVGFETTAPMTAAVLVNGKKEVKNLPHNFSVLTSNKLIPPAMEALSQMPEVKVKGYLAPGHVSTIIGTHPYNIFPEKYNLPTVVTGFEPLDILYGIGLLLRQLKEKPKVENAYPRSVSPDGNKKAQKLLGQAFQVTDARWRGIGIIPQSGLELKEEFAPWDARKKFEIKSGTGEKLHPACKCDLVITAQARPDECSLFQSGTCNPDDPYGPCMVGREAMCNIWYRYGGRPGL